MNSTFGKSFNRTKLSGDNFCCRGNSDGKTAHLLSEKIFRNPWFRSDVELFLLIAAFHIHSDRLPLAGGNQFGNIIPLFHRLTIDTGHHIIFLDADPCGRFVLEDITDFGRDGGDTQHAEHDESNPGKGKIEHRSGHDDGDTHQGRLMEK